MDCDISIPTIPCSTKYDGNPSEVYSYLCKQKPNGWLGEIEKLQSFTSQSRNPYKLDQKDVQVRFRQISPGVVLPQQVKYKVMLIVC